MAGRGAFWCERALSARSFGRPSHADMMAALWCISPPPGSVGRSSRAPPPNPPRADSADLFRAEIIISVKYGAGI